VSWSLEDTKTRKRELRALVKAAVELKYTKDTKLILLTMNESCVEEVDGVKVDVLNVLEWLLF
jgi:hypothetical protein